MNVGKLKNKPTNFNKVTFKGSKAKDGTYPGVTLKKVQPQYTETDNNGNRFIGTFSPIELYGKDIWYMSKGKWYDARNFSDEKPVNLKPLRCYIDYSLLRQKQNGNICFNHVDFSFRMCLVT